MSRQACVASSRKHKVEHAGERSGFDPVRSRQSNRDRRALPPIADAGIETVRLVQRLTCDIHLGDELPSAGRIHGKVDVRRTSRVSDGSDGSKAIGPIGTRCYATIPLKGAVARPLARIRRMQVAAVCVALPDLNRGP